jgi:hypothetical protein
VPGNVITETWLAYAFDEPMAEETVRAALDRVEAHYGSQLASVPPLRASGGPTHGMAMWRHDDTGSRWQSWAEEEGIAVASTAAPAGWRRVVGEMGAAEAAVPLGRALAERPQRLGELCPPFVIAVREAPGGDAGPDGRMTIVNDFAGAGRIYQLRFEPGEGAFDAGGWVWSNRLGALPVFAGQRPEPDQHAWQLFAAAGWFLGNATPIAGAVKVSPGTAIVVKGGAAGPAAGGTATATSVTHRATHAAGELVHPHEVFFRGAVDEAANQAIALARDLADLYDAPPAVDLSGGRDSRISAAAAVAAGIDCSFSTGDQEPGEVEIAKRLVELVPRRIEHRITRPETDPDDDLRQRVRDIHLVHDGMRNPQEIRRPMPLPLPLEPVQPTISGHGGEIAHGFYYATPKKLAEIRDGGEDGVVERLEQAARQKHSAARRKAYAAYREEIGRALAEGRRHGLAGPSLLDYFYLVHRLAYRSGLGARSGRYSACTTPAFVRAAFDLTPAERLEGKLHTELINRLAPEWSQVPFYEPNGADPAPETQRARIWEKPGHAEALEEMIETGKAWPKLFRRRQVKKAWKDAREGKAHPHWEAVFNRIVWREGFEDHLEALTRAATM